MTWRTDFEGFRPMGLAYAHGSGLSSVQKSFWGYSRVRYEGQGPFTYPGYTVTSFSSENRNKGTNGGGSPELIQRQLNAAFVNYRNRGVSNVPNSLNPDGNLGPLSDVAIKFFQGRNSLERDGIVGPATWDRLKTA